MSSVAGSSVVGGPPESPDERRAGVVFAIVFAIVLALILYAKRFL